MNASINVRDSVSRWSESLEGGVAGGSGGRGDARSG